MGTSSRRHRPSPSRLNDNRLLAADIAQAAARAGTTPPVVPRSRLATSRALRQIEAYR